MVKNRSHVLMTLLIGVLALSTFGIGLISTAQAAMKHKVKTYNVAYLSYDVTNSYDATIFAAAKAVALRTGRVNVTVFDSKSSDTIQLSQLRDVVNSKNYGGIIVQPIDGPFLIPEIKVAIEKGIKVVNIDQILGTNFASDQIEVKGLSGNVVYLPRDIGSKLAAETKVACGDRDPCNVALVHNLTGNEPDAAITRAFDAGLANHSRAKIVAQGDGLYTPATAQSFVADTLAAHPSLNVIVGADQDCEGAQSALTSAKNANVKLVCYGASATGIADVKSGAWFADVAQAPATEGELGMIALIRAMKTGKGSGSENPVSKLPNHGIVTSNSANKFDGEWPG